MADPARDDLEKLDLPNMSPGSLLLKFGPGTVLMMTGIGTSHLVSAPTAGGRFAFALLWCIPIAYIFKYYGFEMAFRFTNATGKSIMEAYGTAWKKWPLWYVMITTLIQAAVGQAGRLIAAHRGGTSLGDVRRGESRDVGVAAQQVCLLGRDQECYAGLRCPCGA